MKKDKQQSTIQDVLKVSFDHDKNLYQVQTCQGSSINEMAFAVMVLIKTLIRDGYLENSKDFVDKIQNYLNDPQFEEIKDENRE